MKMDSLFFPNQDMVVLFTDAQLAKIPTKVRDNMLNLKIALEMGQLPKYYPSMSYLAKMYKLMKIVAPKLINGKDIELNLDIANMCYINHKKEQLDLVPVFNFGNGIKAMQLYLENDPVGVYIIESDAEIEEKKSSYGKKKVLTRDRRNQLVSRKKCSDEIEEGNLAEDEADEIHNDIMRPALMSAVLYSLPDRPADFKKATQSIMKRMRNYETTADESNCSGA